MTVRDRMQDGGVYFIGAVVSFVFIGTLDQYQRDDFDNVRIDRIKKTIERLEKKNTKANTNTITYRENMTRCKNLKYYLQDYVPFLDREVIEEYPRLRGDGIVLIVEGNEQGNFWYREEYEKRYGKCC